MAHQPAGSKRRLGWVANVFVILVALLAVTSVMATPSLASEPAEDASRDRIERSEFANGGSQTSGVLGRTLEARIAEADEGETVRALVLLDDQPDVEAVGVETDSRSELVRTLRERVEPSQEPVLRRIETLRANGDVTTHRRHWLVNAVSVEATPGAVEELAGAEGVAAIVADVEMQVSSGFPDESAPNASDDDSASGDGTATAASNGNVTITTGDDVDRSASAPRALNASDEVGLPGNYTGPDSLVELDVEGSSAPDPITGPPSDDIPDAASAPFDDDDLAWGVEKLHADAAAGAGYDGSNVTVAVIDTGIDDSHPDLDDRVTGWKDFVNGFDDPYDDGGHGTHVAGTIAGTGDAGVRTGVAPGADLVGVKVLDGDGSGQLSNVIAGMEWAIRNDADVLSLSLGGPHDPLFHAVTDRAVEAGVVPVVAAGNIGGSRDPFSVEVPNLLAVTDPGHARSAVTVGATHWQDRVAWFSARETFGNESGGYVKPDVTAPGQNVTSARARTDGYVRFSGTSMATPHVSGVAALVLQADPSANVTEVRRLLERTAEDLGEPGTDDVYGAGRVDASAALAAAGEETDFALDVAVNDTEHASTVAVDATLIDEAGEPVEGESVSLNAVYGPPSTLEAHEADADLYAHTGTGTTDENGTVSFAFSSQDAPASGTFTVEATANGGLARNVTEVSLGDDLNVTVSPRDDAVLHNGDTLFFDVEARHADGEPANVTVDAYLHGPTNDRLPGWQQVVTTGPDGNATASVRLTSDILEIYQGTRERPGGPSYGEYGVTTVVRGENGTMRDFEVHRGVAEVEPQWTDLELGDGETPLTTIADIETWLGGVTIGERVTGSLDTTEANETYRIVLASFDDDASTAAGPAIETSATIANVTTGGDGSATFDATVPSSLPGGYYAVVAVRDGRTLAAPGPMGTYDVGYTYVRAIETDIRVESREDANNQAFQPGEAVRITVANRNASTGESVDPGNVTLALAGYTDVTAAQRTGPGTIQVNAQFASDGSPTGVVRIGGDDQNGGTFANHTETSIARPFAVHVEPDATSYEPGENASLDVRVSDSESGAAVEGAELRAVVTGGTNSGTWRINETVRTDDDGAATITVPVPPDAVGIDYLASDAIVTLTSIEKGSRQGTALTGFDVDQGRGPSISVSQNGSESVGLFGMSDVATYEPGERITFEIETSGFDPILANWSERSVDVLAVKYSKVGDGAFIFDANESETAVVELDDEGRATYEYELADDADPGLVVPTVVTRINGLTLSDSQLGIVGASPLNVTTNRSSVGQGERIGFEVTGEFPERADVDFVVKRRGSEGQSPLATVDGGSFPELAPVLAERNRTVERSEPLARDVVDRLPARFGNREAIQHALQEALVPAMSGSLAAGATGGAIEVGGDPAATTGTGPWSVEKPFVVPENLPPGTYRVIAIVHSDDGGSVAERIGFAEFEVED